MDYLKRDIGADSDGDGLPDALEDQLTAEFSPYYMVSLNESQGTGFALFGDYTPETPIQVFGSTPVINYVRVHPLGFATSTVTGQQFGFIQVDYMTLWNRDDGLVVNRQCRLGLSIALGLVGIDVSYALTAANGHALDNERSAVLLAAPTSAYLQYNNDATQYAAYSYYLAAHEGTILDQSIYLFPRSYPIPPNVHLKSTLSLSKHSTYEFGPSGYPFPLIPGEIQDAVFFTIYSLWTSDVINTLEYLNWTGLAAIVFDTCVVDNFAYSTQQYQPAGTSINVGELTAPINGSHFILDPLLSPKLSVPIWSVGMTIVPDLISLTANQKKQFTAYDSSGKQTAVNWSLVPVVGDISGAGVYTAPSVIPVPQTLTVVATSIANSQLTGSATITLSPSGSLNWAACESITVPDSINVGKSFDASVAMWNVGTTNWPSAIQDPTNAVRLGSQDPSNNTMWGLSRVELPVAQVLRGKDTVFSFTATAPAVSGLYSFDWQMVQGDQAYFGDVCTIHPRIIKET